jgi:hypothetical protein
VRINQGRDHLFLTESIFAVEIENTTPDLGKHGGELEQCHGIKLSRHRSGESVALDNPAEITLYRS